MIFFKFDRRLFQNFDWTLLTLVLLLCVIGIINIYSAGFSAGETQIPFYLKQIQWIVLGLIVMMLVFFIDYRFIIKGAYIFYGISIALLLLVYIYGSAMRGSQRWFAIGGFFFQPSELVKLTIILALARYFNDHKSNQPYKLRELLVPMLIVGLPFLLILKQPDLGTALIVIIIAASIIFFIGVNWRSFIIASASVLISMPIAWHFLKDYQKERLIIFFNPDKDPLGAGYHIIQSMIAVGSGGFFGKGFLKGSQTQLKFLPEQQTDFVFSVFAEEWGFIGGFIVIILLLFLILWGLKIALHAKDFLGTIIAFGITALISWQIFINLGMVLGILPVVGIPLPFLSYGGSAMVSTMIAIGLLMNINVRKFILHR
jgi:rod shape determining protein RodA